MKNIFYILITLITISCKNITQSNLPIQEIEITDSIADVNGQNTQTRIDTLTLKSKPFELNNILCSWQHFFVIYNNNYLEIEAKLFNNKTKTIILEYEESPKYPENYNYKSETYFDSINKKYFTDFNFDGLKDFSIYSYGSMPMNNSTSIYLFNKTTKTFVYSEELSNNVIEEIDALKRILKTSSWNMDSSTTKIHYFDKSGKLEFSEQFDYPNDTSIVHYQRIVNQKIVEEKTETIKE